MSEPLTEKDLYYQEQLDAQRGMLSSAIDELLVKNEELEQTLCRLETRNKELSAISYRTFHDMREPLVGLQGLIMILQMEVKSEIADNLLMQVVQSLKRLDGFSTSLAKYTELIMRDVQPELLSIDQLYVDIKNLIQRMEGSNTIKWHFSMPSTGSFTFDKFRFFILLEVLISNVIRFRDVDKEYCHCHFSIDARQDHLILELADNGMGINEYGKNKLFEMFYRASLISEGSGLGLYIANNIVRDANGKIQIESTDGKGTVVKIQIPIL